MLSVIQQALAAGQNTLSESESKKLLAAYQIPLVESHQVYTHQEASKAATSLGFPVVLKGTGSHLLHKTESNMVRLDLRTFSEVEQAFSQIKTAAGSQLESIVVQRMIRSPREFIAGMIRDPQFGPCVMFGLGGILTEVLQDVTFRAAPLSGQDAEDMLQETKSAKLLGPIRGLKAVDRQACINLLIRLGTIGLEKEPIAAIDLNPILIDGDKPVAADALVVLGQNQEKGSTQGPREV